MGRNELWVTRAGAAELVDLSARQFDDAVRPLLPDEATRIKGRSVTFRAQSVVKAIVQYRTRELVPGDDPLLTATAGAGGDGDSEWLEEYRKVQTLLKRKDLEERERTHVNLAALNGDLTRFGTRVSRAGEILQRRFGNEASDILNEAIDDAEREWAASLQRLAASSTMSSTPAADPPIADPAAANEGDQHDSDNGGKRGKRGADRRSAHAGGKSHARRKGGGGGKGGRVGKGKKAAIAAAIRRRRNPPPQRPL